ncbi:MAG TPA: Rieske 2Fe-2S domain-containing protein [Chloroflexota bacterium]
MLTAEENELLTITNPGTPAGEWMRRYWQPVALLEELPPGGAPVPVKLLGEELVLFRDEQGRPGLLGLHCSHRGADLSYGRLEDGGLRCIYHGWLYDVHGKCLEQPGEPAGSTFHEKIQHRAYPCVERSGAIFTYMGPGEPPLLPAYEWLTLPEEHVFSIKLFSECNYLQGSEGNYDWIHTSYLHAGRRGPTGNGPVNGDLGPFKGPKAHNEWAEARLKPYGLQHLKITPGADGWRFSIGTFIMPATFCFGGLSTSNGHSLNWHVPIDDTHHWKFTFIFDRDRPMDKVEARRNRADSGPDYKAFRNKGNRYLQDRDSMFVDSYSGMAFVFQPQDLCATEGAGPIQDRTQEHLGSSDVAIAAARQMMFASIKDVQEGREALGVVRNPDENHFPYNFAWSGTTPTGTDWKTWLDELDARKQAQLVATAPSGSVSTNVAVR